MNDKVRQHFDELSSRYPGHFDARRTGANFSFSRRRKVACELIDGAAGKFLDCASGSGEITAALLGQGRFTEAIVADISDKMLSAARAAIKAELPTLPCHFLNSDVFSLKKKDLGANVDLIVCLGLIAHTGRLDILMSKLKSLLTPGTGRILLQTSLADHWGVALTKAISARFVSGRTGYKLSYFRHDDIVRASEMVGLKIIAKRRHTVGIPFGDRVWPSGNYWVENHLINWANEHGAEALYLLEDAD
jgi:ubiquinone/menaquinone biosynthesis C-methylase UbiE